LRLIELMDGNADSAPAGLTPAMGDLHILGLTADSRAVGPGYLFAALPGERADGRDFIGQAVERGAIAVLGPPGTAEASPEPGIVTIEDDNPRRRLALMAARFHARQPKTIAGITGTNGKTSVATFARQIWSRLGRRAASLGTLGISAPGYEKPASLTTPDPVALHADLAELAARGVEHLALEASSHGLEQYRLDGVAITAAAFTNMSRDHLDYHGSMQAYLKAKLRLFSELMAPGGAAVLNADSEAFEPFREAARAGGHRIIDYGLKAGEIRLERLRPHGHGIDLTFSAFGTRYQCALDLIGGFQAMNALAAFGLVTACGEDASEAAAALEILKGASGRMEQAGVSHAGAAIYVDYAHTPDALRTVLEAVRPHTGKNLCVVFGCGGDRDAGKRPMMGEVVHRLADRAIVTDDNPRGEDAGAIRRAVLKGCPEAREIGDRAQAIAAAIEELEAGDLLIIAGKGHEPGQIVGGQTLPFDDREVAREILRQTGGRIDG
jgi:UDP-N-acetylmuramoyl-L-alanyl-D-glutamate--2,6-diaminopimelate ligase